MKKILLVAILVVAGFVVAVAQPRAIGANIGYGIDVSYQHSLGEANMIDLSVNIPMFNGIGATATYDWINPFNTAIPWNNKGEWNWSLGVGGGLGIYRFQYPAFYVGAVGHVGVSYDFWLSKRNSTTEPVSVLLPYILAGRTFVLLRIRQSPGLK